MNQPTFFIVGAPKCGTTALVAYMQRMKGVFIPDIKEPHYYCTDWPEFRRIRSRRAYLRLFDDAGANDLLGEASVWYAYSNAAVKNISADCPNAKVILCVRNPVQAVVSLYHQLRFSGRENAESFEAAWRLQERRASGEEVPPQCRVPEHLQYRDVFRFDRFIDRILEAFPSKSLLIVEQERLKANPLAELTRVCEFLDIEAPTSVESLDVNPANQHRFPRLSALLMRPPPPFGSIKHLIKRAFRVEGTRTARRLYNALSKPVERKILSESVEHDIREAYQECAQRMRREHGIEFPGFR